MPQRKQRELRWFDECVHGIIVPFWVPKKRIPMVQFFGTWYCIAFFSKPFSYFLDAKGVFVLGDKRLSEITMSWLSVVVQVAARSPDYLAQSPLGMRHRGHFSFESKGSSAWLPKEFVASKGNFYECPEMNFRIV